MVRQAELVPRPLDQTFSPTSVFPTSRYLVTITKCGPSQRSLPMKLNFRMKYFQYLNFKHYCALLGKSLSYSELQMLWSSPDDQNVYLSVLIPTDNWQGVCWYINGELVHTKRRIVTSVICYLGNQSQAKIYLKTDLYTFYLWFKKNLIILLCDQWNLLFY